MYKVAITALLIVFGLGVFVFVLSSLGETVETVIDTPMQAPIATSTPPEEIPASVVPSDWERYELKDLEVTFPYSPEMEVSQNPDGSVRFVLFGPSQSRGTEMYDGIILTFSQGVYESTLKQYVDTLALQQSDDIYMETTPVTTILVNKRLSYKYAVSSLGTFTYIFVPLRDKLYLSVSYLMEDPKEQGFREVLDTILANIVIK